MLPTPSQYPNAEVVIYDGACQFCTRQVEKLNRWDGKQRLAYVSLHDESIVSTYPDLTKNELMEAIYLIDKCSKRHRGAVALRVISRRLPKLWLLAGLLHIPFSLPAWNWIYRQIAKRRYRLNCDTEACAIHLDEKPSED